MAITVRRLIIELKKMPPYAKVCWIDHDHNPGDGEFNGPVHAVQLAPEALKERGFGVVLS